MGLSPIPGEGGGVGFPLPPLPPPSSGPVGGVSSGSVAGALGSIVSYVASVLGYSESYAGALLGGLTNALKQIFGAVVSFLQYIAKSWLGDIIKSIWNKLKQIFLAVQKELSYIVKLFQKYEKLVRYWEQKILGPIINVIQALRKTLVIFRLFHLKFASQLDNYLSGIEGRLTNIFLWYQRELNYVIDALNLIVDPFGLLSEGMFVASAARSAIALWSIFLKQPTPQAVNVKPLVQTPAWQNYNAANADAYARGTLNNGPQGIEAYQLTQARDMFSALGAPKMGG